MIIYNTTFKVDLKMRDEWLQWMQQTQVPEILNTGLFHSFRLCHLLEQDESDGYAYTLQFYSDSMENYNTFINEQEAGFQQRMYNIFGDKVLFFSTLMEEVFS